MLKQEADKNETHLIIPVAFYIQEIKSVMKPIEFLQLPPARRVFQNEFHAAFYIAFKTQWEGVSRLVQHRGFRGTCEAAQRF